MSDSRDAILQKLQELQRRVVELELAKKKHVQIEIALRESEARLHAAIESLPFDFFALDTKGRYFMQNSTCMKNWGNLIGRHPLDLDVGEENVAIWLENNRRALSGETVREEVELVVKGEKGCYFNVIAPIRVDGEVRGILGVNIDITERKRAERALKRTNEKLEKLVQERTADLEEANRQLKAEVEERRQAELALRDSQTIARALTDATTESMILIDVKGMILDINEIGAKRFGSTRSELIGSSGYVLLSQKVADYRNVFLKRAIETGKPVRFQDEREGITFDATISPILDEKGNVFRLAIFAHDITETVKAEQQIRESEEQFRRVTEQSLLGVGIVQDYVFVFCNHALAEMNGYSIEEIQGLTLEQLGEFIHPEDRAYMLEQARRASTESEDFDQRYRVRTITKSGDERWVEIFGRRTLLRGRPAILVMTVDVTDQVTVERELTEVNTRLAKESELLEEKNVALHQMMTAVQQEKERLRSQMRENVNRALMPLVNTLETHAPPHLRNTVSLLRNSIEQITDPTGGELERKLVQLTPREIVICRMILNGSINKEIAESLSVSDHTIEKFRQNIRRKLKLTGKKINLQSYLQSLVTNLDNA